MKRYATLACVAALAGCSDTGSAKTAVADQMKDPSSAQFREVRRVDDAVCGEVNGKNSFGAYSGFQRFFVVDGQEPVLEPSEAGAALDYFGIAYDLRCRSGG